MSNTPRDENRVPGLIAKSDADNTPVVIEADSVTKRLKVNATITGGVPIDTTGLATSTKQDTGNSSLSSIDTKLTSPLSVQGNVASGATDTGNPVKIGGKMSSTTTKGTVGNRTDSWHDQYARQAVALMDAELAFAPRNTVLRSLQTAHFGWWRNNGYKSL